MKDSKINAPLMLISVVISVIMWWAVYSQATSTEAPIKVGIKLRLDGLDTTRFAVVDPPQQFRGQVIGGDERVKELQRDETVEATVDLSNATIGRHPFRVQIVPAKYRDLFDPNYLELPLVIEERSEKNSKVTYEAVGEIQNPNYKLDDVSMEPATVTLSGGRTQVDKVARVRVVLDLGEIEIDTRKPQQARVQVLDSVGKPVQGIRVEPSIVSINAIVNPAPQQKVAFVQADIIGSPSPDIQTVAYEIIPNQVMVRGPSRILARLSQIQTDPIDISTITQTRVYEVGLVKPDGVTSIKPSTVRVRVRVKHLFPEQKTSTEAGH